MINKDQNRSKMIKQNQQIKKKHEEYHSEQWDQKIDKKKDQSQHWDETKKIKLFWPWVRMYYFLAREIANT